ncbi:MAG TPA: hypothetical protein VGG02_02010 [Chthoniobacterales bacterium]|jgi:hypothetical protein
MRAKQISTDAVTAAPARLRIRLKRHADGSVALTCTRADGSKTWQRLSPTHGQVFPAHDLTHLAVETILNYECGFYGLLSAGWEIGDFAKPWPRGPIPAEAREVELIVGLFDGERRMGETWSATEFVQQGKIYAAAQKGNRKSVEMPKLSEEAVARIRAQRGDLLARWAATRPGDSLELLFPFGASLPNE